MYQPEWVEVVYLDLRLALRWGRWIVLVTCFIEEARLGWEIDVRPPNMIDPGGGD